METNLKNRIIKDYLISFNILDEIVSGIQPNFFVLSENQYLTPSIMSAELPFDDSRGEFVYYNAICEKLENLLAGEPTEYISYFQDADDEIKSLFKFTN